MSSHNYDISITQVPEIGKNALEDDQLLLRPQITFGDKSSKTQIVNFVDMIEGYYGEQLFPLIDETVEFLSSQGSNDILHLDTNSILTVENTASITVSSGTQSIFSSENSIYLNQQSGSTNLYVSDFKNLS